MDEDMISLSIHVWQEDEWRWLWTIRSTGELKADGSCASRESAVQTMQIALANLLNPNYEIAQPK